MEAEYEEVLSWVDPGAGGVGTPSSDSASPWGEGIQVFGLIQPLKGCQTANLMADSYGFASIKECKNPECKNIFMNTAGGNWSRLVS